MPDLAPITIPITIHAATVPITTPTAQSAISTPVVRIVLTGIPDNPGLPYFLPFQLGT